MAPRSKIRQANPRWTGRASNRPRPGAAPAPGIPLPSMPLPTVEGATVDERARAGEAPADVHSPADDAAGDELARRFPYAQLEGRWLAVAALAVSAIVLAGVVLRFWTRSALWLDEALTVDIARLPLHQLPAALKRDGAPPLYYVLLHFWMKVFGTSNEGVRSLSGVISVATLPVAWIATRRHLGRQGAWIVLVLLATAPFAVYYATEARMYSLVMFLTACGIVALQRSLVGPRAGNLLALVVVTAALLYTHYWALYLVGTVVIWLAWLARSRQQDHRLRSGARWSLGAVILGCVAFVPWVPTFIFQAEHTGTPWAAPPNFAAVINAITGFTDNQAVLSTVPSNESRLLAVCYLVLAFLGLFGMARDRFHIELDVRTRPKGRPLAFVVAVTLAAAVAGGLISQSGYSGRYASVVFLPLLVLVGLGVLTVLDARIRAGIMAVAAASGLMVAAQNVTTQRTQAPQVAAVLAAHARSGDVVAYCPDQLGPALYRLTANSGYQQLTYPRRTSPAFVNWINYTRVINQASTAGFVSSIEARAGKGHRIWLVWATGYRGFGIRCETIATELLQAPGYRSHQWVNAQPGTYYEPMYLTEFTPVSG